MKVLVTGAGGFIGSHLVEHLVEEGYEVRALVHYRGDGSRGWLEESPVLKDVEVVAGDICDGDVVARAMEGGCERVFNLAAQVSIPHSYTSPEMFQLVNAGGVLNVLTAARRTGCRVIQMSTSETYGTAQYVPMDETHPTSAQSPYAASKVAADHLCYAFEKSYGVDVRVARPFNTYGPRQSQRSVIPNVVKQVLGGKAGILVGTLTATRDFTYVTDTVRALRMLSEAGDSSYEGGPYNIGNGWEINIEKLVTGVGSALNHEVYALLATDYERPKTSEVKRLLCDATKMRKLGWFPGIGLDEGVQRVAKWLHSQKNVREGRVT